MNYPKTIFELKNEIAELSNDEFNARYSVLKCEDTDPRDSHLWIFLFTKEHTLIQINIAKCFLRFRNVTAQDTAAAFAINSAVENLGTGELTDPTDTIAKDLINRLAFFRYAHEKWAISLQYSKRINDPKEITDYINFYASKYDEAFVDCFWTPNDDPHFTN